jgi:UDPglucose 6-dehydrogenase
VHVYDPVVQQLPERWPGHLVSHARAIDAVVGADALVVGTEWPEFRQEVAGLVSAANPDLVVIDANRHLQAEVASLGVKYVAVGTPTASKD